jgi:hypothetical protein
MHTGAVTTRQPFGVAPTFFVADVVKAAAYCADLISDPCDETSYGMREFSVRDLDGYILTFAQDISAKGAPS